MQGVCVDESVSVSIITEPATVTLKKLVATRRKQLQNLAGDPSTPLARFSETPVSVHNFFLTTSSALEGTGATATFPDWRGPKKEAG